MRNKLVLIVGATASGKSGIAVNLAKKFNGEIVSCDSMQVYKDMNIGTAKVTLDEMQGIPHYMIDVVDANKEFSVGEYVNLADGYIKKAITNGKLPIAVGGTGLYVDGLMYPMSFGGNKNQLVREQLEKELELYGKEYMYSLLIEIDPNDAKKIHPNNTKRVLRALEIYRTTGKCKSDLQEKDKELKYDVCMIALDVDRKELYERIDNRVDKMIEYGLLDEIKFLLSNGVTFESQSMQAIGYKEFKEYFEGTKSFDETVAEIKQNSRNYAKRQITWFKKYQFAKWFSLTDLFGIEKYVEEFLKKE